MAQAEALDKITVDRPLDVVIDLDVPRDDRAGPDLGPPGVPGLRHELHGDRQERQPWICEVCGGDVMQRDDDTPDAVNRRLDLYETQTAPLIEFYEGQGRLVVVDGVGHPDDVFRRLTTPSTTSGTDGAAGDAAWPPGPTADLGGIVPGRDSSRTPRRSRPDRRLPAVVRAADHDEPRAASPAMPGSDDWRR